MIKNYFSFLFLLVSLSLSAQQLPVMMPIAGPDTVCSSPASGGQYTASATNSPNSYQWSVSPSAGVTIINGTTSVANISFPNTSFSYTVYCVAVNGAGTSTPVSFVVTVYETPTVTFSGASTPFCQGSSTNLSASPTLVSGSSTLTYSWMPSTGLSSTTGPTVTAMPMFTTTYTVLLTLGSCTNTANVTVTISTCVGIGELKNAEKAGLLIYPNPSSGVINLRSEYALQAELINQLGQVLRVIDLRPGAEVQLSGLINGIYFIRTERTSYKVIVDH